MTTTRLKNITFDDRNAQLQYNPFWYKEGIWNATSVKKSGTLTSANDLRANVTFNFPESANAFYYYGILRSGGGKYGICIDCDPETPNFDFIDGVNRTDNGQNPPVLLYSREFNMGQHVVILTNQPDPRFENNKSQITIDRFEIQVVDSTPVETSSSRILTTSSTSLSGTPQATSGSSSTNVGAIAGGVIGGCVTLLALIAIVFCLWRRRYRNAMDNTGDDPPMHEPGRDGEPVGVTPYTLGFSSKNTLAGSGGITTLGASSNRRPKYAPTSSFSTYVRTNPSEPSSSDGGTSRTTSSRRREVDAGRIEVHDDDGETLPPDYDQVFHAPISPSPSQNPSPSLSRITGNSDRQRIPQAPLSPQRRKE